MVYQGLTGVELRACPLLTHSTVLIRRRESPTACAVWPRHIRHECRTYMCKMVVRPWPLDRIATRLLATVGASCEFRSLQCGAVSRPPSRGGHPLSQTEQSLQHRTIIDAPCRSAQPDLFFVGNAKVNTYERSCVAPFQLSQPLVRSVEVARHRHRKDAPRR